MFHLTEPVITKHPFPKEQPFFIIKKHIFPLISRTFTTIINIWHINNNLSLLLLANDSKNNNNNILFQK